MPSQALRLEEGDPAAKHGVVEPDALRLLRQNAGCDASLGEKPRAAGRRYPDAGLGRVAAASVPLGFDLECGQIPLAGGEGLLTVGAEIADGKVSLLN